MMQAWEVVIEEQKLYRKLEDNAAALVRAARKCREWDGHDNECWSELEAALEPFKHVEDKSDVDA